MRKNSEYKVRRIYFIESKPESAVWVKHLKVQDGQTIQVSPWKRQ